MRTRNLLLALVVAIGIAGCGGERDEAPSGRLSVVATTTQIGDFARNVAGDRASVDQLLPANADPHEYEPAPTDIAAVADADLVLENGVGLDDWLDDVIRNAGGDATRVTTTAGITLRPGDDEAPAGDPHVWLDPRNAVTMVRAIEAALTSADPDGRATYRANADAYVAAIDALDAELERRIAAIPEAERTIVTDHDAVGYFAARYGITVVGTVLPSLSTAAEPSARELAALAATIRREGVRVVFSEASIDQRLQAALADEAGVRLGDPLYGDALGPPDATTGTYLGMMRSNMDAIIAGLST